MKKIFFLFFLLPSGLLAQAHYQPEVLDSIKIMEVFKVVEQPPIFFGCETTSNRKKQQKCSKKELERFIEKNLVYPETAKKLGIEGTVLVQFLIDRHGFAQRIKVVESLEEHCDQEAIRVIELLGERSIKWIPAKQRGRPVFYQMNVPVKFEY